MVHTSQSPLRHAQEVSPRVEEVRVVRRAGAAVRHQPAHADDGAPVRQVSGQPQEDPRREDAPVGAVKARQNARRHHDHANGDGAQSLPHVLWVFAGPCERARGGWSISYHARPELLAARCCACAACPLSGRVCPGFLRAPTHKATLLPCYSRVGLDRKSVV